MAAPTNYYKFYGLRKHAFIFLITEAVSLKLVSLSLQSRDWQDQFLLEEVTLDFFNLKLHPVFQFPIILLDSRHAMYASVVSGQVM